MHTLLRLYFVPVEPLCPLAVNHWLFLFYRDCKIPAGMTLVHRKLWTPDLWLQSFPLFCCPNAGIGFEDISIYRKAGQTMKVTVKRKKNVGTLKRPVSSAVGVKKPIACNNRQMYHAVARTQAIPRRAKRGA